MRIAFHTICSDNYFQYYIPIYCYTIQRAWPEAHIHIGITGRLNQDTKDSLSLIHRVTIRNVGEKIKKEKPNSVIITENALVSKKQKSAICRPGYHNTARFLYLMEELDGEDVQKDFDYMFITDLDFVMLRTKDFNVVNWIIKRMDQLKTCYYTHHGPVKPTRKFPQGWSGARERLAGGIVCITPEWLKKTCNARHRYRGKLQRGEIGTYREEDEVTLCKITKESGMPVIQAKFYHPKYSTIHFGDYKPEFKARWQSPKRMKKRISQGIIRSYIKMTAEPNWQKIKQIACRNEHIKTIFSNFKYFLVESKCLKS